MHMYMNSFLLSMFIIFFLEKMRNYKVPGQNYPQTLNYDKCQKNDLHVYNVFSCTVTGFKKSRNFANIQKTCEAKFIGSIIG